MRKGFKDITEADIRAAAARNISVNAMLRDLGIKLMGGNHTHMSYKIKQLAIDTSHFDPFALANQGGRQVKKTTGEIFIVLPEGSRRTRREQLRRALLETGEQYECRNDDCPTREMKEWRGRPLKFQVDHIDGEWLNNLRSNLRFLCANCHAQTETYGKGKQK